MVIGKLTRIRAHLLAASVGASLVAAPVAGQSSQTCDFALLGWISTQLELQEARRAYRACTEDRRSACTAEQGRVRSLELRLRLLRNYVEGYCRR